MIHSISWYIVLLVSVPETFLYLSIGFNLFNLKISNKKILTLAILNGIIVYYLRGLSLVFGIHTILILLFLVMLSRTMLKLKIIYSLISITAGILITGLIQSALLPLVISAMKIDLNNITNDSWLNFFLFIPALIAMLILDFFIKKYRYTLYNFEIDE
ncbi:hypothetical protein [Dehalobacterium formicoaceticum]|uniref:hypothetical protein n=1 Tax=Dehalobacterium formicoaceticum TaxID=51515 RepID=UPI000B7CB2C4|nr:hypothetical protein [Dehalobacterium formicoaceticum]